MDAYHHDHILVPGRNCWRVAHAARAAFLIDGAAFFSAVRAAALKARRTLFIIGWDVDSRAPIGYRADDGFPTQLGDFLDALAKQRRGLHIYVLDWDFTVLYAADREMLPVYKLGWRTHRRVHFHLDNAHPVGASQHQKIVTVDDAVAFVGGLDLTSARLDTPAHAPDDPCRRTGHGDTYAPFHDVQLMVDGDAAAAIGALARERWRRATGTAARPARAGAADPWPETVEPDMREVEVGIARTDPRYADHPAVQEVRTLYLDAIAAARRSIYIENQYLTSDAVGAALIESLRAPAGPEIVIVSRLRGGGWLEKNTMGVLRARLMRRLRAADVHGRLRIFYPDHRGYSDGRCIDMHSKLMIVDDRLARVGSANLNNRSMGLDSECDLAIEATTPAIALAIAALRARLLAEHLGVTPATVAQALERADGSLIAAIAALSGNTRTLRKLPDETSAEVEAVVARADVIDPEEPIDPEQLVNELMPAEEHCHAGMRMSVMTMALLALAGLAAAWRWTPLGDWVDIGSIMSAAYGITDSASAPFWVLGAYLLASLTAFPITVLIVISVLVFGPSVGFVYALTGSLLGAALTFALGQALGQHIVRRLAGARINKLSQRLGQRGLLAMLAVRLLPVAPFTIVNLVAGASHIRFRDYALGTALGMLPGMLALTVFSDRVAAVVRDPSPTALAVLAAIAGFIVAGALGVRAWLKYRVAQRGVASGA
jgi:phosphatidylserine/phosphatidylglycerophosphate/cardiolipin synthase-like enzyme/uncharacterized membrane protein YdjX (TVP38/TMEM64 family)